MKKLFLLAAFFLPVVFFLHAQMPSPGPRTEQGRPVRLTPVPIDATPTEIQSLLAHNHYLYFRPGVYNIGTLEVNGWKDGLLWGAGRLTTTLRGSIVISGSTKLTIGNFNIINNSPKGEATIDVKGSKASTITFLDALVSAGKDGTALRFQSPGQFIVQGCNPKGSDVGISIQHPLAYTYVFGGNMASNRIHVEQLQGHLDARAFGMQVNKGDADIVIHSRSPLGYHIVEGIRSEGNNGANPNEMLVKVPPTTDAVNVALRANGLGSMTHYADYNAAGTLLLLENVNYPGADNKNSVGVTAHSAGASKIISVGNKYGLSYDTAPGPFDVGPTTTVQSIGDLWMLPNKTDYSKHFDEPITKEAMQVAGKTVPRTISFLSSTDSASVEIPDIPPYKFSTCPRIKNLSELMLNVTAFGAIPNDGKDDHDAIQLAMDSAEKGGVSQPIYFPTGRYELSEPLFLDHLAGGGFWGDGADKSVLVSTSGKGVITSDGAGYSSFVDMGFENKSGAETRTTDFDWINNQSPDKKRGNTGAALQANMFYRDRFENGAIGMGVGKNRMGDGFVIADCVFRNIRTVKTEGAAYASEGFNALTNPLVHCLFDNVDCAILTAKGCFNFYGNQLSNLHAPALKFVTIVGNGFAIVNNQMDASPVPFVATGHSSAKAHLLIEHITAKAPPTTASASDYSLGGSVLVVRSSFVNRNISNAGGIGDNSLIVYKSVAANASVSGRAHGYILSLTKKNQ